MSKEENLSWAKRELRSKYETLGRVPKKDDFDPLTLSRIKAFLGPWPRALEKSGLKPERKITKKRRKRKKAAKADDKNIG